MFGGEDAYDLYASARVLANISALHKDPHNATRINTRTSTRTRVDDQAIGVDSSIRYSRLFEPALKSLRFSSF
jgi:hypothetical protein